jgi:hypothetical protein
MRSRSPRREVWTTTRRIVVATLLSLVFASVCFVSPAYAEPHTTPGTIGNDISFPQCGGPLPKNAAFGIVGVNGGRAFTANPCLKQQLAWAKRAQNTRPAFYANTGNPGPAYTRRWPIGQTSPRVCRESNPNASACAYDYGWNAAKHSFRTAVDAVQQLNGVSRSEAIMRTAAVPWWLDVETMNSWQTLQEGYGPTWQSKYNDTNALLGAVRALSDEGITRVGIYSTAYQWKQITGGRAFTQNFFAANPVWLAGYEGEADARAGCNDASFTGGPVQVTQFLRGGFDANVRCR